MLPFDAGKKLSVWVAARTRSQLRGLLNIDARVSAEKLFTQQPGKRDEIFMEKSNGDGGYGGGSGCTEASDHESLIQQCTARIYRGVLSLSLRPRNGLDRTRSPL